VSAKSYFLSSHCAEDVCISLELFVINHSGKRHVKENTLPNCCVVFY